MLLKLYIEVLSLFALCDGRNRAENVMLKDLYLKA